MAVILRRNGVLWTLSDVKGLWSTWRIVIVSRRPGERSTVMVQARHVTEAAMLAAAVDAVTANERTR